MKDSDLEKFDPAKEALTQMVAETAKIVVEDLSDRKQVEAARRARIDLKNARVRIKNQGEELRADAVKFQKAVIAKEKELIAIIEPEETRLQEIEEAADELAERTRRRALLPERLERVSIADPAAVVTEDQLLALDDNAFEVFCNQLVTAKNRRDREAQEAEAARVKAEQDAEAARLKAESDRVAAEKAEVEAEKARIAQDAADAERREAERVAAEAAARAAAEKAAAEAKAKREKAVKYVAFRKELGWTEETRSDWKEEVNADGSVTIWKKAGVFSSATLEVAA